MAPGRGLEDHSWPHLRLVGAEDSQGLPAVAYFAQTLCAYLLGLGAQLQLGFGADGLTVGGQAWRTQRHRQGDANLAQISIVYLLGAAARGL